MPVYSRTLTIAHQADHLFDLVADIRRYPEFIRWIRSMSVSAQREEHGVRHCIGEARVGFSGFTEAFATTVAADPVARTIRTGLLRGPFRKLNNSWSFTARADGGTDVAFQIDYEFRNPILRALAAANFDRAVNALVAAFVAEADRRHGRLGHDKSISN